MRRHRAVVLIMFVAVLTAAQEQDKSKRPSPPGTAEVTFADGKKVTIDYSRPSAKRPKDLRRTRALRRGLAYRRKRGHIAEDRHRSGNRRNHRSGRQLHAIYRASVRIVEADH